MHLTITVNPDDVSFSRVEMKEVAGPASNLTGDFLTMVQSGEANIDDLAHHVGPEWIELDETNEWTDAAFFGNAPQPYAVGSWTWDIPVQWRVVGKSSEHSLPNRTQVNEVLDPSGKSKVDKLGQSETRTP